MAIGSFVVQLVVAVALSLLAGYLLKKKNRNLQDDKPTTLVQRGAFIPVVKGVRRVGPIFAHAGDRHTRKEYQGGKGRGFWSGKKKKTQITYEAGWHILAIGPLKALHKIDADGKVVFDGPITPVTHPSGSTVDLGDQGSFRIYWGERDQPVDPYLEQALGVASRWPGIAYIVWVHKRLGQFPNWPQITYVIEAGVYQQHLTHTDPWHPSGHELDPDARPWPLLDWSLAATPAQTDGFKSWRIDVDLRGVQPGAEGVGRFAFPVQWPEQPWAPTSGHGHHDPNVHPAFNVLSRVRLVGNSGVGDQDFNILNATVEQVQYGWSLDYDSQKGQWFSVPLTTPVAFLYPEGGVPTGAGQDGELQLYASDETDGLNPAHILADLWFSPWPHGIGADPALFDMTAFEEMGTTLEVENLRASVIVKDGEDLRGAFAGIQQDIGAMLPINFTTGLLTYKLVREAAGLVPFLGDDALVELPETEIDHGPLRRDRVVYRYTDRRNNFREMTVTVNASGNAALAEFYRQEVVDVTSTVVFETAALIAERRSQETLNNATDIKLVSNRGARRIMPGTHVECSEFEDLLVVKSVEMDPLDGRVTLECMVSAFGLGHTGVLQKLPSYGTALQAATPDLAVAIMELPEAILFGQPQTIVGLRIRAHSNVSSASLHLSGDNVTYTPKAEDLSVMQGGTLEADFTDDTLYYLEEGPVIQALGDDALLVLDLTGDEASYQGGRQLAYINGELFYLKKLTSLGGGRYRLDGLLRARFDTRPFFHGAGSPVFIFQDDDGEVIQDALVQPDATVYLKSQPSGSGTVDISTVTPAQTRLYGKGVVPVPVSDIRLDMGQHPHRYIAPTGADLHFLWSYSTPQTAATGAGSFPAGNIQVGVPPEGDFLIEVLNAAGTNVLNTYTSSKADWTYPQASRVLDGTDGAGDFHLRVTQTRGGYNAAPVTQAFEAV